MNNILVYFAMKYNGDWDEIYSAINRKERVDKAEMNALIDTLDYNYITLLDEYYPQQLKPTYKPPFVLFYKGDISLLNERSIIAISGGNETETGKTNTQQFVKELTDRNFVIANKLNTTTDFRVASECSKLHNSIQVAEHMEDTPNSMGLVISERPYSITQDNKKQAERVLVGISHALFLIEADKPLQIVNKVLEQNKDVFCIPGSHFCNHLIKEGAYLTDCVEDIVDNI